MYIKKKKKELQNESKINDFNINENSIENNYKTEFYEINIALNNELKSNENNHNKELKSLELKYNIQKMKINNKYKEIYNKIKEKNQILKEEKKHLYEKKKISIKLVNNIDSLILISEIIKNTQEKYADNYFYNININNLLKSFSKSQNEEIKQLKCLKILIITNKKMKLL